MQLREGDQRHDHRGYETIPSHLLDPRLHLTIWRSESQLYRAVLQIGSRRPQFAIHHRTSRFLGGANGEETSQYFLEYQFLFWPVPLDPKMHMKRLPTQSVLPIELKGTLSGRRRDTAVIKKCHLQPSSNLTVPGVRLFIPLREEEKKMLPDADRCDYNRIPS